MNFHSRAESAALEAASPLAGAEASDVKDATAFPVGLSVCSAIEHIQRGHAVTPEPRALGQTHHAYGQFQTEDQLHRPADFRGYCLGGEDPGPPNGLFLGGSRCRPGAVRCGHQVLPLRRASRHPSL